MLTSSEITSEKLYIRYSGVDFKFAVTFLHTLTRTVYERNDMSKHKPGYSMNLTRECTYSNVFQVLHN